MEQDIQTSTPETAKQNNEQKENIAIWKGQLGKCVEFFNKVAELVGDIYEVVPGKSTRWRTFCLTPKGTAEQISYYGKPVNSLRVAPVWNWRASMKKCSVRRHIQCVTQDLPYVKPRPKDNPDGASSPVYGNMVAIFDTDRKYHCLYGERYDRKAREWIWKEDISPEEVADMLRKRLAGN